MSNEFFPGRICGCGCGKEITEEQASFGPRGGQRQARIDCQTAFDEAARIKRNEYRKAHHAAAIPKPKRDLTSLANAGFNVAKAA